MIGQDEEHCVVENLEDCIPFVDEIVFVDGGSVDDTVELVASLPKTRVIHRPFPFDFGDQYTFAFNECRCDWILLKDCDEVFDDELLTNLQRFIEELDADCYAFNRMTYLNGYLVCLDVEWNPRFWPNHRGYYFSGKLHSGIVGPVNIRHVNGIILHHKTAEMQQQDNVLYWNMGQTPPAGWEKIEGEWTYNV